MTNAEINKLLHERVMGERWVEEMTLCDCPSCRNPSYTSSWEDYGRLLEVAMTKEWWPLFIALQIYDNNYGPEAEDYDGYVPVEMLNPLRGSTAMAEFVKERI